MRTTAPVSLLLLLATAATAQDRVVGYSVDSDGSDELYAIELTSGEAAAIGPVGFSSVEALAFAPDGRLFGFDDQTQELIVIDLTTGAGALVGTIQGATASNPGMAFDLDGTLWLASSAGDVIRVDPASLSATVVEQTGFQFLGMLALGPYLYAVTDGEEFVRLSPETGAVDLIGTFPLEVLADAGLAVDPQGNFHGLDCSGQLYSYNPLTGAATAGATTQTDCESLAIPLRETVAYAIDSDSTDHLWRLDLVTGAAVDVGPVGFGSVEGMSFSPTGVLFGVDDSSEELLTIDTFTGAGTLVGPLGQSTTNPGLAFDDAGGLFIADNSVLFGVNPATGVAAVIGGTSSVFGLDFVRGRLLATTPAELVSVDPLSGALTALGTLDSASGTCSGLAEGPVGGLFWYQESAGSVHHASGVTGASVRGAVPGMVSESLAIPAEAVIDGSTLLRKFAFTLDRDGGAGSVQASGYVGTVALPSDLASAQVSLALGDQPLASFVLDAKGGFKSAKGVQPRVRFKLNRRSGAFSFSVKGVDLAPHLNIPNADGAGSTVARVELRIGDGTAPAAVHDARFALAYAAVQDGETSGKWKLKSDDLLTGLLHVSKVSVKTDSSGSADVKLKASILGNGGGSPRPIDDPGIVGDVSIRIGDAPPVEVPRAFLRERGLGADVEHSYLKKLGDVVGLKSLQLSSKRGTLKFKLDDIFGTGVPLIELGTVEHVLVIEVIVQTAGGPQRFVQRVLLRRANDESPKWKG